jgi:hypothetical protein
VGQKWVGWGNGLCWAVLEDSGGGQGIVGGNDEGLVEAAAQAISGKAGHKQLAGPCSYMVWLVGAGAWEAVLVLWMSWAWRWEWVQMEEGGCAEVK